MAPMLVVILLIVPELVLQVGRSPEESLIKELLQNAANQSLDEGMRHRYMRE
jgi:hypothetical protein